MLEVHTKVRFLPSGEKDGEAISQQCNSGFSILGCKVSKGSRKICEPPSAVDQNASHLESGDQLTCMNGSYQNVAFASLRSGPPSAGTTKMPLASCDHRENAICVPSGDQAGLIHFAGWSVSLSIRSEPIILT